MFTLYAAPAGFETLVKLWSIIFCLEDMRVGETWIQDLTLRLLILIAIVIREVEVNKRVMVHLYWFGDEVARILQQH